MILTLLLTILVNLPILYVINDLPHNHIIFSGVICLAMALMSKLRCYVMTALPVNIKDLFVITDSYFD
ncbi:hypothetical protein [Vulcanisaeta thermophila]|uniref:hypothetical protein n=1 Tax=Vulcanisaeta thermophila TaxID=867917 RepID=UPI000852B079|nr:hypothetical protein [Vulcanisaeta thermophila]